MPINQPRLLFTKKNSRTKNPSSEQNFHVEKTPTKKTMTEKLSPLATPELETKILETIANNIKSARKNITQGINEVTKKLNKGKAVLVVMASDAEPIEIIQHLKILCEDKDVNYVYVSQKSKIGEACGSVRGAAAVCLNEDTIGVKEILNELHF